MGGLLSKLFGKRDVRILMVGLGAAGKTTILYKLKLGGDVQTMPTLGFNVETVELKNIRFTVWDVGGQESLRPLWRHYYKDANGIIFVVDSHDKKALPEAREELQRMLDEEELAEACVLVFANKQDLAGALPPEAVGRELGLRPALRQRHRVQPSTATRGDGLIDGLDWLAQECKKRPRPRGGRGAAAKRVGFAPPRGSLESSARTASSVAASTQPQHSPRRARDSQDYVDLGEYASGQVTGGKNILTEDALRELMVSRRTRHADPAEPGSVIESEDVYDVEAVGSALDRQDSFRSCLSDADDMTGEVTILTRGMAQQREMERRGSFAGTPRAGAGPAGTPRAGASGRPSPTGADRVVRSTATDDPCFGHRRSSTGVGDSGDRRAAPAAQLDASQSPAQAGLMDSSFAGSASASIARGASMSRAGRIRRKNTVFRKAASARSLPAGLCRGVLRAAACDVSHLDVWDFTQKEANIQHLQGGGALFACCAGPGSILKDTERGMIGCFDTLSAFADEARDNGMLPVDLGSEEDLSAHIFLLSKSMYLLQPGVAAAAFCDVAHFCDVAYQRATQPSGAKVFDKGKLLDRDKRPCAWPSFCATKQIIPWVLSMTVQYRVSEVPQDSLAALSALSDGLAARRALLLERTKQDRGQDATKRAKTVLLLHDVDGGGLLVTCVAFSCFTQLPSVARKLIDKIGLKGAEELKETAQKTRHWWRDHGAGG